MQTNQWRAEGACPGSAGSFERGGCVVGAGVVTNYQPGHNVLPQQGAVDVALLSDDPFHLL